MYLLSYEQNVLHSLHSTESLVTACCFFSFCLVPAVIFQPCHFSCFAVAFPSIIHLKTISKCIYCFPPPLLFWPGEKFKAIYLLSMLQIRSMRKIGLMSIWLILYEQESKKFTFHYKFEVAHIQLLPKCVRDLMHNA